MSESIPQTAPEDSGVNDSHASPVKVLSPAAQRALAEAQARRTALEERSANVGGTVELGGRTGPDPVRYLDWENNGIASDF